MIHIVYIALGTNMGDRLGNLQNAEAALLPAVQVVAASSIYETAPWGYADQPDFLNQVLQGETELEPLGLLQYMKQLEIELGRKPSVRYGPRLIDLDILFYDDLMLETAELVIPHPRLVERAFVLVPLAELAPDLQHPRNEKIVQALLNELDTSGIKLYKRN